jgi:hypothetical protein
MNAEVYALLERGMQYALRSSQPIDVHNSAFTDNMAGLMLWDGLEDKLPEPLLLNETCRVMHFSNRPPCSLLTASKLRPGCNQLQICDKYVIASAGLVSHRCCNLKDEEHNRIAASKPSIWSQ